MPAGERQGAWHASSEWHFSLHSGDQEAGCGTVNPRSETAASVAASDVPMFPSAEEPAVAGLQACCRSVASVARVAAAVAEAGGESSDRFVAHASAGRAAADDTG